MIFLPGVQTGARGPTVILPFSYQGVQRIICRYVVPGLKKLWRYTSSTIRLYGVWFR
jgi:hypothetical protein